MENTRKIYFKDNRKFLKYAILKEHEWYLYRFQKKLRAEEKATDIVSRFIYRFSKNILGTKLGIYIPAGVFDEGLHIWHYGNIIVNDEVKKIMKELNDIYQLAPTTETDGDVSELLDNIVTISE